MNNQSRTTDRRTSRGCAPNIVTSDDTVVCPEHYRRLRQGSNWHKAGTTIEHCEICRDHDRSCHGRAFCAEPYCGPCNSL